MEITETTTTTTTKPFIGYFSIIKAHKYRDEIASFIGVETIGTDTKDWSYRIKLKLKLTSEEGRDKLVNFLRYFDFHNFNPENYENFNNLIKHQF